MKLEWMRLTNFRQFFGEQVIRFSGDAKRNVTVVHGVNGAGKTSLFVALNWVLYDLGAENVGELVCKRAIDESPAGTDIEMVVVLSFLHNGERYTASRALTVSKTGEKEWQAKPTVEFALDIIRGDGQTKKICKPSGRIESILPSDVRTYCFVDAAKIDQFNLPSHEGEVREAVRNVLKIEVLERAKTHLGTVARQYRDELTKMVSGDLEKLLHDEADLQAKDEKDKERLGELREERTQAQKQIHEIDQRLGQIQEIREWDEERKSVAQAKDLLKRERNTIWQEIREACNRGFFRFGGTAISKALTVLDEKRERGEIPAGIREQFVLDLIDSHMCICGRHIEEDSEEYQKLKEVLRRSLPSELEDIVLETAANLKVIQPNVESVPQRIQDLMRSKSDVEDQVEALEARLDEISRHFREGELEAVSDLERKRVDYDLRIQALAGDIGRYEERTHNNRIGLENLRDKIEREKISENRAKRTKRRYSLASKSADAIEQMFDVFSQDMRRSIQEEANSIFQRLAWKESQFEAINLNEDYRIEVIDRWWLPARSELSAGERQVLSLSFITGMSRVTGEEAPLVMDTPFGRLSSAHREAIAEHIPEIAKQLVIFVTDEELHTQARANLEPYIGAEYDLDFNQETGCTEIRELAPVSSQWR